MILSPPAIRNGAPINAGLPSRNPVNTGASDAPVVRATDVIPEAAERSSGATTAMV